MSGNKATVEKSAKRAEETVSEQKAAKKKSSAGLRIAAIIFWLLAIGFEVLTIYLLNLNMAALRGTAELSELIYPIGALVLDAICCIIGSLFWKKANRVSPCKSKNGFVKFVWNQMGVIACVLAFLPFGLWLLLKTDALDKKTKTIFAVLAAILFTGAVLPSIDYNPPTADEVSQVEQAQQEFGDDSGTTYWTRFGHSYHFDKDCPTLTRTIEANLFSGTVTDALEANRDDPCDFCAGGAD